MIKEEIKQAKENLTTLYGFIFITGSNKNHYLVEIKINHTVILS